MKIVDFITPQRIVPHLESSSKTDVLRELAAHLVNCEEALGDRDIPRVTDVLLERERLASTGISDGVAIPHGKMNGLSGISACLGIKQEGLDFAAIDNQPSRIFIVLLAPENSAGMHLKALARISRLFKEPAFRASVLDARSVDEIYSVVAEEDARN